MLLETAKALIYIASLCCLAVSLLQMIKTARVIKASAFRLACQLNAFFSLVLLVVSLAAVQLIYPELSLIALCCIAAVSALHMSVAIVFKNTMINPVTGKVANEFDNTDPLTGIHNRRHIDQRADSEVVRSRRYGAPLSVLAVGINNFNRYNTDYGYQSGDLLLKAIAIELTASVRKSDIVARYKDDQFLIILPDTPEGGSIRVLERLQRRLKNVIGNNTASFEAPDYLNVKFGEAWCSAASRSGTEVIQLALGAMQTEKVPLNKQDSVVLIENKKAEKALNEAA